jgi:hypothetical protein
MSVGGGGAGNTPLLPPPPPPPRAPPAWLDAAAGIFAGSANVVAGHPFDTVKVVMQAGRPGEHAGAIDATRHVLQAGGVRCSARPSADARVAAATHAREQPGCANLRCSSRCRRA